MQSADFDEISRRPLRTINTDGIPELVVGAQLLLWGVLIGIPELIPKGQWWRPYWWMIIPFVLMASGLAAPWITKRLKERFIYRRAGYVEFRKPKGGNIWAVIGFALCTGLVSSAFFIISKSWLDLLPVVVAAGMAVGLHFMLRQQTGIGAYVYPLLCLALGAIGLVSNLGAVASFAVLYIGLGLAMSIGGGVRLIRFVRTHEEVDG
jgi:hypothetical protein